MARESLMALVLWRFVLALVLSFCAVAVIAPRPAPAADVIVTLDQSRLVKLPEKVATIVIGNPLIADASLQPGGVMVITGKGYGTTNFNPARPRRVGPARPDRSGGGSPRSRRRHHVSRRRA
jgi:ABC-type Fe3+-hydroxamate transport system substrate-binding protein